MSPSTHHPADYHRNAPVKIYCRVATTASITIATALNSGDTIDGVTLANGDRVLVKDQATGSQNGIYVVSASPVRAYDMDTALEVLGTLVYVIAGTTNGGKVYRNTNTTAVTLGTTALTFAEFGAGVTDHGALTGLADDDHSAYEKVIEGGQPIISAHGNMGATETFDPTAGNVHTGTLNANCVFTLDAPVGTGACTLELYITASGTRTWTWPGSVVWPGGVTPDPPADTLLKRLILETLDGGTTWYGVEVGGGIASSSFATPAIVLGTAAAAGVATTTIRSDSTIVAFDATVPASVGSANATGSAAVAARRDHVHAGAATTDQHAHVVDEQYSGDAVTTVFTLANTAAPDSVMAWVSGTRTPVTLGGSSNDQITFGSAPASAANNISVDYAAVAS